MLSASLDQPPRGTIANSETSNGQKVLVFCTLVMKLETLQLHGKCRILVYVRDPIQLSLHCRELLRNIQSCKVVHAWHRKHLQCERLIVVNMWQGAFKTGRSINQKSTIPPPE